MTLLNIFSEAINRGWENFIARPDGPMNFRFILQPAIAMIFAIRAGIRDAKSGNPAYIMALIKSSETKKIILLGWKEIKTPFIVSVLLDIIYQIIVHRFVYPFEVLFTAVLLVVIPYFILRGPANRFIRMFIGEKK